MFSLLALGVTASYSEQDAKLYVRYAGAAYCTGGLGKGVENWDCKVCKTLPHLNTTIIYDRATNTNGYVGYDASTNSIFVVFAGTDPLSIKDWIDDIDALYTDFPCPAQFGKCKVHKGFYDCYLAVRQQMLSAIAKYQKIYPTATAIKTTGHSLGAALATHAALELMNMTYSVNPIYHFGSPRVGNPAWEKYYFATFTPKTNLWRVTHNHDPVPHLPTESMGYAHLPVEVFYDEKQSSYVVCDQSGEDPHCSDKYIVDLDVLDHLNYLQFDFTTNYLSCKL